MLARWSGGKWAGARPTAAQGFSNDTRQLKAGQIFVALATDRRDGHDYLEDARRAGATAALTQRFVEEVDLPQLVVGDCEAALAAMAEGYRKSWRAQVVGITGSCGKTSCKDLLATMLDAQARLRTVGNLNNLIGVPMSILRPEGATARYAILEAGISVPGEMASLARMIDPDWVIVTAIGPAHLDGLGSESGVAAEKGILTRGERVRGVFLGSSCEPFAASLGGTASHLVIADPDLRQVWRYRTRAYTDETEMELRWPGGLERWRYRGAGEALASNVALAAAAALSMGVPSDQIASGLEQWSPSPWRGEWRELPLGRAYVDCYNANPLSMRDALKTFGASTDESQPRLFVIGCMGELGERTAEFHEALAEEIPFRSGDLLLVIGEYASSVLRGMKKLGYDSESCIEIENAAEAGRHVAEFNGNVFLKGSRRYRLEVALPAVAVAEPTQGRSTC